MTNVSVGISLIFDDIEQMDFSFRSAQQKEMSYFGEKPSNLETFLIASHPTKYFSFWNKTIFSSSFIVYWRLHIA